MSDDLYLRWSVLFHQTSIIEAVARNRDISDRYLVLEYLEQNWNELLARSSYFYFILFYTYDLFLYLKRFNTVSFTLASLLTETLSNFNTENDLKRVQAFFANNDFGVAKDSLSEITESINTNMRWMVKNYNAVVKFLVSNNSA